MGLQETSANGTLASDNWRAVSDLLGFPPAAKIRIVEGFLNVLTNAAVFQLIALGGAAPTGSSGGDVVRAAGSVSGYGPANPQGLYKGYPLDRLYVRNNTNGQNAKLAFEGVVWVD